MSLGPTSRSRRVAFVELRLKRVIAALLCATFIGVTTVQCRSEGHSEQETRIVGLLYLPDSNVSPAVERGIERAVSLLARRSFRPPLDTVNGLVYPFGDTSAVGADKRYLLALPFGDRERGLFNDTAAIYVLTVSESTSASNKYAIPLGPGEEMRVVHTGDVNGDGATEAIVCVLSNSGAASVIALTFGGGLLRAIQQDAYRSEQCPQRDIVP